MFEKPCVMCNDKQGLGAPPKPKQQVCEVIVQYSGEAGYVWCGLIVVFLFAQFTVMQSLDLNISCSQTNVCQRCINCKTCSAQMTPGIFHNIKYLVFG